MSIQKEIEENEKKKVFPKYSFLHSEEALLRILSKYGSLSISEKFFEQVPYQSLHSCKLMILYESHSNFCSSEKYHIPDQLQRIFLLHREPEPPTCYAIPAVFQVFPYLPDVLEKFSVSSPH